MYFPNRPILPIRTSISSRDRGSQESKVTSTPRTLSPALTGSPSISSIDHEEIPMEIDSDIGRESREKSTSHLLSSSSFAIADDTDEQIRKVTNIKWLGIWSSLKPKNKDTLYFKVFTQPVEIESTVIDFINVYNADSERGVLILLQFFLDLCGYKKLNISKVYDYNQQNSEEVVNRLKDDLIENELKKTGKFLFMRYSTIQTDVDCVLDEFFKHLVMKAFKADILFSNNFRPHIFEFVNCMAFSPLRNVRVTGVILALKILTAFVALFSQFISLTQDENSNNIEEVEERRAELAWSIDFLYIIFDKNCLLPDRKSFVLKIRCAQDLYYWIKLFPELFIIKRKCLGRLMKLVLDVDEKVRRHAISTCEKLMMCKEVQNEFKEKLDLVLKIVSTRVLDSNMNVAVKAINIFTLAMENYPKSVPKSYKLLILCRMFESNLVSAKAAGQFLAKYLEVQYDTDELKLMGLINVAFLKAEFADRISYFLEACVDYVPLLFHWNLMVTISLDSKVAKSIRINIVHVFHQMVRYALLGNFSKSRQILSKDYAKTYDYHCSIHNTLIPNFVELFNEYQEKNCLRELTEMLTFINYEVDHECRYQIHYEPLFTILKDLFQKSNDKKLLENITNIFGNFCEQQKNNQALITVEEIKNKCVNVLLGDLKILSPYSKELQLRWRTYSLILSIIFSRFNLTTSLHWNDIFHVWDEKNFRALKYLIVCCKWHLVWDLRKFKKDSIANNWNNGNPMLQNNCKTFVCECIELLKHANEASEFILVFETLCDFYISFELELRRKRQFSVFFIKVTESDDQNVLLKFATRFIIENTRMPLNQRQVLLTKLINIMYLGVIPVEHFSTILSYYHTHYQEFGVIIKGIIQQLSISNPALPLLVMHTLIQIYDKLLEKYGEVNIASDDAKDLRFLCKKFVLMNEIKSSGGSLKFVTRALRFALRDPQHYPFLYFASYFAKTLKEEDKSDAYDLFSNLVPDEARSNDNILLFAAILKPST